jgi:hypothetical protein
MPVNTSVDNMFRAMRSQGMPPGKAARVSQSKTGLALSTGKPPKGKTKKKKLKAPKKKGVMSALPPAWQQV